MNRMFLFLSLMTLPTVLIAATTPSEQQNRGAQVTLGVSQIPKNSSSLKDVADSDELSLLAEPTAIPVKDEALSDDDLELDPE
jgi:hypothetical protein